uniref:Uncharacterized protein n=1 Tax=Arundo donax TaxID=35708 RepID=A0A0A9B9Q7_ARUDO
MMQCKRTTWTTKIWRPKFSTWPEASWTRWLMGC